MKTMKIQQMVMVVVAMVVMGAGFSKVNAQCGWAYGEMNTATGGQLNVAGVLDDGTGNGTILTKFWILGQAVSHNSGTLPTTYQSFVWGTNSYYVWSNWGNSGVYGDCPATTDRSLFLYSIQNGGNGQYILLNAPYNSAYMAWDFDAITNGNGSLGPNTEEPVAIPALTVASQAAGDVTTTLNLTWPAISNLKGFYDVEPSTNLITGVAIRYYQGASAPTSFKTSDWPVAGVVSFGANGSDPGQATIQLPNGAGLQTYVALSVLFDGGVAGGFTETAFVGASTLVPPPPPPCQLTSTASAPAAAYTGSPVSFTCAATTTGCIGTPTFLWIFGDGATSSEQNPSHAYAVAGSYPWSVTVTLNGQVRASDDTITVTNSPSTPPVFTSVSATKSGVQFNTVKWTVTQEDDVVNYTVQALRTTKLGFATISGAITPGKGSYSFTANKLQGTVFRIAATLADGSVAYSSTVSPK